MCAAGADERDSIARTDDDDIGHENCVAVVVDRRSVDGVWVSDCFERGRFHRPQLLSATAAATERTVVTSR